ncbi:MAG: SPOR domain-containing protein, partial [Hyphomicrobiaceae bacterium]|nr:SPOR domain-containing protein [Hyphomicrobiaceae bacterium]
AKVRPVDVGPPGSTAARPDAAPAERQQVANASPSFAPPSFATGFVPSATQDPAPPPAALPAPRAVAVPAPAAPPPSLGRPPSSLDQQHALLSAGLAGTASPVAAAVSVPRWRLNGPAVAPAAGPAPQPSSIARQGGFEVQIGALNSPEEADRLLSLAQSRVGPALVGRPPVRKPVTVNGRTLQRARFTGFDQASAATACAELVRQQFSCLVMRAD